VGLMLTLVLRQDPQAVIALLSFVVGGILACFGWLWWLWWTLWKFPCGHTPKECSCRYTDRHVL
jgi:hypothetical protein